MPFASLPGTQVHYTVDGEGPALMLLHGTGGDGFTHWGQLLRHLRGRRVIRPDYAGSGRTSDAGGPLQLEDLAAQMLAVMEACGETSVDLVGYSLGAVLAAFIAARHPQRVRKLVLVAGFVGGTDARAVLQFGLWRDLIARDHDLMARFLLLTGAHPEWLAAQTEEQVAKRVAGIVKYTNWDGMARQAELDERVDINDLIIAIQAPTRLITGDHDTMVPAVQSDRLTAIADASAISLRAGHLLPLEVPAELAREILDFLDA